MRDNIAIGAILAGCILVIGGLIWAWTFAEGREIAAFNARCLAAGKAQAECDLLVEIKRSSDDAGFAASVAVGMAIGAAVPR